MSFESFEELIEFAIEKEKEAAAFYTDLAGRTSFSGVKDALEEMAEEENTEDVKIEEGTESGIDVSSEVMLNPWVLAMLSSTLFVMYDRATSESGRGLGRRY